MPAVCTIASSQVQALFRASSADSTQNGACIYIIIHIVTGGQTIGIEDVIWGVRCNKQGFLLHSTILGIGSSTVISRPY